MGDALAVHQAEGRAVQRLQRRLSGVGVGAATAGGVRRRGGDRQNDDGGEGEEEALRDSELHACAIGPSLATLEFPPPVRPLVPFVGAQTSGRRSSFRAQSPDPGDGRRGAPGDGWGRGGAGPHSRSAGPDPGCPRPGAGTSPADARVRLAGAVRRPEARVPQAVLGAARHLLPGAGRRRRRDPARRGADQPRGRGGRAGPDGPGDHPVHGRGLRRAPQPGGVAGLRAARRLPVEAGAGLHRRPAARRDARLPVPAGGLRQRRAPRRDAARAGLRGLAGVADGDRADRAAGQRDPRHRVGGPERRRDRARSASAATSRWPGCGRRRSAAPR